MEFFSEAIFDYAMMINRISEKVSTLKPFLLHAGTTINPHDILPLLDYCLRRLHDFIQDQFQNLTGNIGSLVWQLTE